VGNEIEFWMLIVSTAAAVVPWAFSIHAKVAVIANSVESLPDVVEQIRKTLAEHEVRLDEHAKKIQTIEEATVTRH
jgi:ABC-type molybdate transport system permease subunit